MTKLGTELLFCLVHHKMKCFNEGHCLIPFSNNVTSSPVKVVLASTELVTSQSFDIEYQLKL